MAAGRGRIEPAPRRVRGFLGHQLVFDTTSARYVWEVPYYPQYYIPLADVQAEFLRDENHAQKVQLGPSRTFAVIGGGQTYESAARVFDDGDVAVDLDGTVLADTHSPVLLFETGLPTRYYIDRTDVAFEHLEPSSTQSLCPYKGVTSGYWSVRVGDAIHADLAWTYHYPLPAVAPIAGMVAFYNEKLDITVDGVKLGQPQTHFG
jgi:uncharacterized protein (DUF427 family)